MAMQPLGSREKLLLGVIAVLVIVLIVFVLSPFVPSSPEYSADLNVHIDMDNINMGETVNYTIFADGHRALDSYIVGQHATEYEYADLSITVKWSENETHLCLVEVFCKGTRYTASIWVADGLEGSTSFHIWA